MIYEKRFTARLAQYWDSLRKDRELPEYELFNPAVLEDMRAYLLGLRIIRDQSGITCYTGLMGDAIARLMGRNLSGEVINPRMKTPPSLQIVRRTEDAMIEKKLLMDEGQFVSDNHKIIKYRSCLIPFGTEQNGVTHVVIGVSWKEF